jgi:hypothetical protein
VSVSTIGTLPELSDQALEENVRSELGAWFGSSDVASWRHLRTYRIPFAQPGQAPPTDLQRPVALGGGLYVCGDHRCARGGWMCVGVLMDGVGLDRAWAWCWCWCWCWCWGWG